KKQKDEEAEKAVAKEEQDDEKAEKKENKDKEEETAKKDTNEEDKEEDRSSETVSQQNAVGAAKNYIEYTAFSKTGLIEQLEFEGFSNEDATYAVNEIE